MALSEAQKTLIEKQIRAYVEAFTTPQHKATAITRTKMPLQTILKNPADAQWRTFRRSNSLFKEIVQINNQAFESFLEGIGFTKVDA